MWACLYFISAVVDFYCTNSWNIQQQEFFLICLSHRTNPFQCVAAKSRQIVNNNITLQCKHLTCIYTEIAFCAPKKERTSQPQHSSRCRSRLGNKLVSSDKWASAHCSGIRDEQRCENVTANSLWSPNVTSSLCLVLRCSGPLPLFFVFISFFHSSSCLFPTELCSFLFLCPPIISPDFLFFYLLKRAT